MEGLKKSVAHQCVDIIDYVAKSVVTKTILKKTTGNISALSFDTGEGLKETTSPFDSFAQIIEGSAEVVIDGKSQVLVTGQSIIIPAHKSNMINAQGRFKMLQTVIKSGYE